jgi:hypothetical protein
VAGVAFLSERPFRKLAGHDVPSEVGPDDPSLTSGRVNGRHTPG